MGCFFFVEGASSVKLVFLNTSKSWDPALILYRTNFGDSSSIPTNFMESISNSFHISKECLLMLASSACGMHSGTFSENTKSWYTDEMWVLRMTLALRRSQYCLTPFNMWAFSFEASFSGGSRASASPNDVIRTSNSSSLLDAFKFVGWKRECVIIGK